MKARGGMKPDSRGSRSRSAFWRCFILSLVCLLCDDDLGCFTQPVHASNSGNPSTVRPIAKSKPGRRLSFLPSRNSRKAAKEAYLLHLQNELESAQRQLYVSQNTCTTLRKRWEEQRKETLGLIASRNSEVDEDSNIGEEEQLKILEQKEEIEHLKENLRAETVKYKQQVEKLDLLSAELKELQYWKENEEKSQQGKLIEYKQQLQDSNQKQSDYAEQVQLLTLKLEAAELVAKQNQQGDGSGEGSPLEERTRALRSELESVRSKYSKLMINSLHALEEEDTDKKHQLEEEMDKAIQTAIESVIEASEKDWSERYGMLQDQLNNVTEYATRLESERDSALKQVKEALTSLEPGQNQGAAKLSKKQKQKLKEELAAELTDSLTEELSETLTVQLTETLSEQIEKKYKKKLKRLRQELKEQQQKISEDEQSQEDMSQKQQQMMEDEIKKVKEQYELEYETKLQQMQKQSEEQVQLQKERMRKLVRALVERESKQKEGSAKAEETKSSSRRKKKYVINDGAADEKGSGEDLVPVSLSTSRKKTRPRPGVVPVSRNR